MGLDMYLDAHFYVKNWEFTPYEKRHTVSVMGPCRVKPDKVKYVIEEVGYWRKANAVHKWFVDNCGDGRDDCQEIYVSPRKITQLKRICKLVLGKSTTQEGKIDVGWQWTPTDGETRILEDGSYITNAERYAARYLPTESGFFFGSTEYDEYYLDDVRDTIAILEAAEDAAKRGATIYYQASW